MSLIPELSGFAVKTNKNSYHSNKVVIAKGYLKMLKIKGLETYIIPHKKSPAGKNRIQSKNEDHLVAPNLYVAGTLSGHRSQFAIACDRGAVVAIDI